MSESLEQRNRLVQLYDCYGGLLTAKQKEVFEDVYEDDLSFSEISENRGISRAAVSDSIKRTCALLEEYEEQLGLVYKRKEIERLCSLLENKEVDLETFLAKIKEVM